MQESVDSDGNKAEPLPGANVSGDKSGGEQGALTRDSFLPVIASAPKKPVSLFRIFLLVLLSLPVIALVGWTIISILGSQGRDFELLTHLRFQYAIGLSILLVLTAIARSRLLLIPVIVALAINLADIAPLYIPSDHNGSHMHPAPALCLTIVTMNVNINNKESERIAHTVNSSGADIVCLQEFGPELSDYLIPHTKAVYPHSFLVPQLGMFGIGILSKSPLANQEKLYLSEPDNPTLKATFTHNGRPITIIATHPIAPLGEPTFRDRNKQLERLAEFPSRTKEPIVLAGDLNVTPFSPFFKKLIQKGGYADTTRGFGFQPTWVAQGFPFNNAIDQVFNLPLDHVLVHGPLLTLDRKTLDSIGSDHRPLRVSLYLPE